MFSPMTLHIVAQEWYKSIYSIQYQIIFHIIRIIHLLVLYYILRKNMSPPTFSTSSTVLTLLCSMEGMASRCPAVTSIWGRVGLRGQG